MNQSKTIVCKDVKSALIKAVDNHLSTDIFVLTDENSYKFCYQKFSDLSILKDAHLITIPSGDENKNIDSVIAVWKYLSEHGATRNSLLINVGGGMITDIGGFIAATFKRGINYINVSTTILGAVDAATGGKTGINFLGLKNEIGTFNPARAVIIDTNFFKTLDEANLRSGYAEMIKHALIDSHKEWEAIRKFDMQKVNFDELHTLIKRSLLIKEKIVAQDPKEQNIRKALNLGHTFGHAFESYSYRINQPVLHGYAVMWGLLCELYLSHIKLSFPKEELLKLKYLTKDFYGMFHFDCDDYEALYELMTHDKKNISKKINFTLLSNIGEIKINQTADKNEIFEVLDFYLMG